MELSDSSIKVDFPSFLSDHGRQCQRAFVCNVDMLERIRVACFIII